MSIRRIPLPSRAMAVALVAVFLNLAGVTYAATGGSFILGQANTATTPSVLSASVAGKTLQLSNSSTALGATPLGLAPGAGRPPFATPSTTKVTNLNADKLDGIDSTGFYRGGSTVADSARLGGHGYSEILSLANPAAFLAVSFKGVHQNFAASFTIPQGDLSADGGRDVLVTLNASAYSATVSSSLGVCVALSLNGGTPVTTFACARGAANETLSHKTLVPIPHTYHLSPGNWTATLVTAGSAETNNDDYYSLTITAVTQ
jgi:hypothetical protein